MYVSSICAVYDSYFDVLGNYTGTSVEEDDGSISFVYTHTANSDITIEVVNVAGADKWRILHSGTARIKQSDSSDLTTCPSGIDTWRYIDGNNDYADCSLEVQCGTYTDVSFDTSGLTSSVTQSDFTLSTEDVSSLTTDISSCCSGINTDNAVELKSSCLGDRIQTTLVTTYTPNGDTLNDRNVYTGGSSVLFYSSTIEAWVIGSTAGDITDVAIVQGAVGYCPNEKETNMYMYGSNGWKEDCGAKFDCYFEFSFPFG